MFCVFQSKYVYVVHVGKFYDSLVLHDFLFNQIVVIAVLPVSSKSCISCFLHLHSVSELVSLILSATATVKTCFTCK